MRRFLRNKRFWLILVITVVLLASISYTSKNEEVYNKAEDTIIRVFSPIQRFFSRVGYALREGFNFLPDFYRLREEREVLIEQVEELEDYRNKFIESVQENIKLRELLGFRERNFQYDLEAAQVIGREPGNWFDVIVLDKGEKSGIAKDMAVITNDGLVGTIFSTGKDYSKVLLITDDRSSVGAAIQRTRDAGLLKGSIPPAPWGHSKLVYLPRDTNLVKGDVVVTSGNGAYVPKGLVIGEVIEVVKAPHELTQSAIISPKADLQKLEYVFVVKELRGVSP